MADPRQARVLQSGPLLALEMDDHPGVVLQGGKYIIINTGLTNSEGKLIKRAYSLFAVKPESRQFFLAAEPVADGIGSRYLREIQVNDVITFSGPWGKFFWPATATESTVIAAAFGTGITGVLGYLSTVPRSCAVHLYWYEGTEPLVNEAVVRECVEHPNLTLHRRSMEDDQNADLSTMPLDARYITAGEGRRAEQFLAYFRDRGVPEERLQSEIFYRAKANG